MLLLFRPYRVGDTVEIGGRTGTVKMLDLFVTELATPDNLKVVLPNGKVFGDVIVNTSYHSRRRVDAVFRVDNKRDVPALLAGLKARGITTIYGVELIDRGYEALDAQLRALGAHITREENL